MRERFADQARASPSIQPPPHAVSAGDGPSARSCSTAVGTARAAAIRLVCSRVTLRGPKPLRIIVSLARAMTQLTSSRHRASIKILMPVLVNARASEIVRADISSLSEDEDVERTRSHEVQ